MQAAGALPCITAGALPCKLQGLNWVCSGCDATGASTSGP